MVQQYVQFGGLQDEDLNAHLANFLDICNTFKIMALLMMNKTKQWLNSLLRGSITTCVQMTENFLLKYFPQAKTTKLRNNIFSFVKFDL
ncbi:RING-H2 finger protein ATL63 [Gossypium australe]|uniref:RING-H2 finger protein ATL63 n=1 Tax=Gossypium australe TaxID=47621 RepID=A0A5B6VJW0_9ROSI|nr:RING-H2 finger protein ATL63 [Gossypium australe]